MRRSNEIALSIIFPAGLKPLCSMLSGLQPVSSANPVRQSSVEATAEQSLAFYLFFFSAAFLSLLLITT